MDKEIIKNLQINTTEDNCDLFLTVDILPYMSEFVNSFAVENKRNILVLPEKFPSELLTDYNFAEKDVTIINSDRLGDLYEDCNIITDKCEILIPWAECAVMSEYGYKADYKWIGELRASKKISFHITAFFSAGFEDAEKVRALFCSADAVFADLALFPAVAAEKTKNKKQAFMYLNKECTKSVGTSKIIIFTTRRELKEFVRCLDKDVNYGILTGKEQVAQYKKIVTDYNGGITEVLLMTKSALYLSLILKADKVMYCGIPYSVAHASRCAMLSNNYSIDLFYSETDRILNTKIIFSNSQYFDENFREDYIKERTEKADRVNEIFDLN